ncbi:MAG: PHP domain-containing protein [Eubacteriales bacterium]|nr:PHP domain-containing protein [Eubacteriales bacterium]
MHIHSALSPCGDNDMTPNNIVNMSIIKGLDMIAVTDHNSCGNVAAVMAAAGENLLVVPGMEVETSEEVHIVCYFPTLEQAIRMEEVIKNSMTPVQNRPEIFGRQFYINELDEIIGEEENLLVSASGLDIYEVVAYAEKFGGVAVPAHIDRTSYSVLSNLGFMPPDLRVSALEITAKNRARFENDYKNFQILTNSDAHYLENIAEREYSVELEGKNAQSFIEFLCKNNQI